MADIRIPKTSVEYVKVEVTSNNDPTGNAVSFSFSSDADAPGAYTAGSWETSGGKYYALCLFNALAAGTYWLFVKVVDSPETPVMRAGRVVSY